MNNGEKNPGPWIETNIVVNRADILHIVSTNGSLSFCDHISNSAGSLKSPLK